MKPARVYTIAVLISASLMLGLPGCGQRQEEKPAPTVTITNLQSAYAKSISYHSMYAKFADEATKERKAATARMYRALARSEQIHADAHARLIRTLGAEPQPPALQAVAVGTTTQTLKLACSCEGIEIGSMYPNMIKTAESENVPDAAAQFALIRDSDATQFDLLNDALQHGGNSTVKKFYICPGCGRILTDRTLADCPGCKTPKDLLEVI